MPGKSHDQKVPQEILDELNRPASLSEMPRRINLCEQALAMISKEEQPGVWGLLHNALAISLAQTPSEPRAENIEQAIQHFEQALEVRTRQKYPKEWAMAQNNLGTAYRDRIHGERAENIEKAIEHYREALTVRSSRDFPKEWAMTQNNLAGAYYLRIRGDRAENLEQAIRYFEEVLAFRTRQGSPEGLASTQNDLATVYRDRIRGERAENIEQAIDYYEQALKVRTRESAPERWALTQNNLALAYYRRIRGNRAESLECAIRYAHQALEVFASRDLPYSWAQAKNTLGEIYRVRLRGSRMENIEQAIYHFEQALEVHTSEAFPQDWALLQHNLGVACTVRIGGGRAENIEQAIYHLEQALKVYGRLTFPQYWASIQYDLGNAYRYRIRGDQAGNIEQAIHHLEQALEVRTDQTFPEEWAQTRNNLGNVYLARIHGKREENIGQAISHFQKALEVQTEDAFPYDWAQTRNNLGNAYLAGVGDEQAKDIEQAIANYQQALKVRTQEAFPEDWAETLTNLAGAELVRASEGDIEQAILHLQQALEVYTYDAFPQTWARTHNNLAIAYTDRKQGERAENIEQAIRHYQDALVVYTPQSFPVNCLRTGRALGNLAFEEQRWELARMNYDLAFEAQDALMQASFSPASEKAELAEAQNLPPRAAYAHFKAGNARRAVEALEKGRTQLLRESFELQRRNLERLPALGFQNLHRDYMQARGEYQSLQTLGTSNNTHPADWQQALAKVQSVAAAIREHVGQEYPEYKYFLKALSFEEIQKQAQEKPLVYLIATHAGGLALVVGGQNVQFIEMPGLEQEALQKQIWRPSNEEITRINAHLLQGMITLEDIQAVRGGFFSVYALWSRTPYLYKTSIALKRELFTAWQETLGETTHWLWDMLMSSLVPALKEHSQEVVLIPAGQLAMLPLHAAWTEDPSRPAQRRYALDELNISYAPSAHALRQARLAAMRPAERLMAVDNPDGSLFFSEIEVRAALDMFKHSKHLNGDHATVQAVKAEMQKAQVLHFATHGVAGWEKAEDALLKLADNGRLTLPDIFDLNLNQARLAVLSACESGVPSLELPDEMIGLPGGMMQAGVPGVVGTLWSVEDMSTAVLMIRFYSFWREAGHSPRRTPQEALRQAQIWLRDSTTAQRIELFEQVAHISADTARAFYKRIGWDDPEARVYQSPYFWAAFSYTGV